MSSASDIEFINKRFQPSENETEPEDREFNISQFFVNVKNGELIPKNDTFQLTPFFLRWIFFLFRIAGFFQFFSSSSSPSNSEKNHFFKQSAQRFNFKAFSILIFIRVSIELQLQFWTPDCYASDCYIFLSNFGENTAKNPTKTGNFP